METPPYSRPALGMSAWGYVTNAQMEYDVLASYPMCSVSRSSRFGSYARISASILMRAQGPTYGGREVESLGASGINVALKQVLRLNVATGQDTLDVGVVVHRLVVSRGRVVVHSEVLGMRRD